MGFIDDDGLRTRAEPLAKFPLVGPGEEFAQGVRLPGRHLPDLPLGGDPAQDGGAAPIVGGEEEGLLLLRDRGADPDRPGREGWPLAPWAMMTWATK